MSAANRKLDARGLPVHPTNTARRARMTSFAAVLLMVIGVLHVLQGVTALVSPEAMDTPKGYILGDSVSAGWGWAHLALGVVALVAGWFLVQRASWARGVCVVVVTLSMFTSFLWIPYYPFAALVVIALDIFVMWAAFADYDPNAA